MTDDRDTPKRTAMQVALSAEQLARQNAEELANISALAEAAAESGGAPAVGGVLRELQGQCDALQHKLGELLDWRAGFLGANGPKGVSKIAEQIAELRGLVPGNLLTGKGGALATQEQVAELGKDVKALFTRLGPIEDWRMGLGGRLPSGQADEILSQLERRTGDTLAELRGQIAELTTNFDPQLKPQALFDSVQALNARLLGVEEWQAATLDEDNLGSDDALRERLAEVEAELRTIHMRTLGGPRPAGATTAPHVLGLIVELKKQVGAIGKDREARHPGGRYDFRGVDDAMNAVGNACNTVGIVPPRATVLSTETVRTVVGDRVWTSTTCTMRYTFQSPVDGSEWSTEGIGEGRDLSDKSVTKAQAAALKYALFHGLAIPIAGMNVDAETEHPVIDSRDAGRTYGSGQPPVQAPQDVQQRVHAGGYVDGMPADEWQREQRAAQQLDNWTGAEPPQDIADKANAARAVQQQPIPLQREDTRSPEEKATAALTAARRAANLAEVNKIIGHAQELGIMDIHVNDGSGATMPLRAHLMAAGRLVPRGGAQ